MNSIWIKSKSLFKKGKNHIFRKPKVTISPAVQEFINELVNDLLATLNIILNEREWCQRALARDEDGEQLFDPFDERAVSWDLLGAMHKAKVSNEVFTFLNNSAKMNFKWDGGLDRLNDLHDHRTVVDFLMYNIALCGVKLSFKHR